METDWANCISYMCNFSFSLFQLFLHLLFIFSPSSSSYFFYSLLPSNSNPYFTTTSTFSLRCSNLLYIKWINNGRQYYTFTRKWLRLLEILPDYGNAIRTRWIRLNYWEKLIPSYQEVREDYKAVFFFSLSFVLV